MRSITIAFRSAVESSMRETAALAATASAVAGPGHLLVAASLANCLGALLMGCLFGLIHVIGPDHLGTLMTLSTVLSPRRAFQVGAAWGLGHTVGMVLIGCLLFGLRHLLPQVKVESWEHYGNYVVGASMAICAVYFMVCESKFLEQRADGSIVAKPCPCHGPSATQQKSRSRGRSNLRLCSGHREKAGSCGQACGGWASCKAAQPAPGPPPAPASEEAAAASPLLKPLPPQGQTLSVWQREKPPMPLGYGCESGSCDECCDSHDALRPVAWWEAAWAERDVKGVLLGVLQGACCPMGLVGVSFIASPGVAGSDAKFPAAALALFLLAFVLTSTFGTGIVAACWAQVTSCGAATSISAKGTYRASCGFTLVLGICWMAANALGYLSWLDYTDRLHERAATIL